MTVRPSLARLTTVELRKMADTRSGAWLLAATTLVAAAAVVLMVSFADAADLTMTGLFGLALFPVGVLLPVVGILAVTTEWTQRTALTTFALVPARQRVASAKLLAAVLFAVVAAAASLGFAAAGNAVGAATGGDGSWRMTAEDLGGGFLFLVINMLIGVAFGMLLMNSAFAIVTVLVVPTVWSILGATIKALEKTAQWLDTGATTEPLVSGEATMTGESWAKLATSVAVWVVLPLVLGLVRLHRREVS